jgi:L,D-transpeptidase ErfK/SrfK
MPFRSYRFSIVLCFSVLSACAIRPPLQSLELPPPEPYANSLERHHFFLAKGENIIGQLATVTLREGDTLPDVARHFGLGYQEIGDANPEIDVWTPAPNSRVFLPVQFVLPDAPKKGVVINLATMRLFYFPRNNEFSDVITYPVGTGRQGRSTPMGQMMVERKAVNPTWYVPASIRQDHALKGDPLPPAVLPGPSNPLGNRAMYLSRSSYLIHGTNKPYSIGLRASNGCIRLYPENIERLFQDVPVKTPVRIVNQPYLLGWRAGSLYLEAHRPYPGMNGRQLKKNLYGRLKAIERKHGRRVDWAKVEEALVQARGIPVPVFEHQESLEAVLNTAVRIQHPDHFYGSPEVPPIAPQGWYLKVAEANDEKSARRLAALLNHQGPQIPARTGLKDGRYRVIAGPFKDSKQAKEAVKRLKVDLEIKASILQPASWLSEAGSSYRLPE